jgi:hypothetical protein
MWSTSLSKPAGLGAGLALTLLFVASDWAAAQQPQLKQSKSAPVAKTNEARRIDMTVDQKVNQAREEIELMELQVETRRAQLRLAEARLAESKRWLARFEKLMKTGFATEERYLAARDDVLLHETHVASEKAGVQEAELRVKQAKRRLTYGEFPLVPSDSRVAEIEQRLESLEKGLDLLQQEVGNLKRIIRPQGRAPD